MTTIKDTLDDAILQKLLKETHEYVCILSKEGYIIEASSRFKTLYQEETLCGEETFVLYESGICPNDYLFYEATQKAHASFDTVFPITNKKIHWTSTVFGPNQEFIYCHGTLAEVEKRTHTHDSTTGLLNYEGLSQVLKGVQGVNKGMCFFINISGFTSIINYYGREVAEDVLVNISNDLKVYEKQGHIVSRIFGDKFVVLLLDPTYECVKYAFKQMEESILKYRVLHSQIVQVKKNIGFSIYPEDHTDFLQLISCAELANKHGLANPRNQLTQYQSYMMDMVHRNISFALKLQKAIKEERIEIHFQKIVDSVDHQLIYVEALARWYEEGVGYIRPDSFIKIAQDSHMSDCLEDYLVHKTMAEFAEVKQLEEFKHAKLTLNLSSIAFFRHDYVSFVEAMAKEYRLNHREIVIEVSENAFVKNLGVCKYFIDEFRNRGFLIAIDDFGRDYSSLSVLRDIDYDIIKIDRGFVLNIDSDKSMAIIEMLIKIAHSNGKQVIAEGVESEQISLALKKLQCYLHQGYYYHRPEKIKL